VVWLNLAILGVMAAMLLAATRLATRKQLS